MKKSFANLSRSSRPFQFRLERTVSASNPRPLNSKSSNQEQSQDETSRAEAVGGGIDRMNFLRDSNDGTSSEVERIDALLHVSYFLHL